MDEFDFKLAVAKTSDLIKYLGQDYLDKLNELNDQYNISRTKYLINNKVIYDNDEIEKFRSYIKHSSDWLRKIKQLIDGDYIFDNDTEDI